MAEAGSKLGLPPRFERVGFVPALLFAGFVAFFAWSLRQAEFDIVELVAGIPNMARIGADMIPPDTDRAWPMLKSLLVTFQMALVGTVLGIVLSVPLAALASASHTPHRLLYSVSRGLISLFRTVPDLAWALFFVASVGLGPFAGTLTIVVDTIGFCGRFFAENMEEADPGPAEALTAIGGNRLDVVTCAAIPCALPAMINTSLFSLEKAVRSSVVLGLVGAGGIGVELAVSMEMFRYDQAATIVLMILLLVMVVEIFSATIRKRLLSGG